LQQNKFILPQRYQKTQKAKAFDPVCMLCSAERVLRWGAPHFVQARWESGTTKDKSDILIYGLLKGGALSDDHIGKLFGMSYSAASHDAPSLRIGMRDNQKLLSIFSHPYSQFKL